ncbi:MAG: MATE family efflux transporter [Alcanivorax sp.]|uniref:Multidrug-efflux transporter n=1 Tax=Alloalcanivorax venustensis ISO4 TaxID=1177184 RepID=A0ABS0AHK8_9GAMM|nr:MATE family efflux transporter [Alloalcanivorax venustensis]KXJ43786.1 MAG: MATE family efflux transporter [Alcanivorax sp. Nap_24]MAD69616.1 MATE family efflux transporter [Alcanivorax sp.]MEA3259204.1 MATE family efflux transporter [Pseudomonadota bacterium]MAK23390.1 MATE family efflux transporter [Alcanivorax sp.]MAK23472.1 MATE family efflux transporter [Alcanivorax sp.]
MLNLSRSRRILALALPIMAAMASQSLMNLVDAAMVGSLGGEALAGVGLGGYASFIAISMVIGLGAGVQAMVARRKGERDRANYAVPLNAGLVLGLAFAIPISVIFALASAPMMAFLAPTAGVAEVGSDYFDMRLLSVWAVAMNFSYRGYWNGINRSGVYMRTLVITHVANVIFSYGLIFGAWGLPALGGAGAGLGTSLALYLGSALYLLQTWRAAREHGFLRARPSRATLRNILRISLPNGVQQFFFATGLTVLFWIIGRVGADEVAVAHILITLILFLILPAIGLGLSAASLVGQALGRRDADDAYRWGWDVTRLAVSLLFVLALPMWLVPDLILGLFLKQPALVELGRAPLMITGLAICLDGVAIIFTQALLGAGAARSVMVVTLAVQWFFFLPLAYIIGPVLGYGLLGIWLAQAFQRLITSLLLSGLWIKRGWAHIEL